eukprot:6503863-Pyramimonas_sp.AAC.1
MIITKTRMIITEMLIITEIEMPPFRHARGQGPRRWRLEEERTVEEEERRERGGEERRGDGEERRGEEEETTHEMRRAREFSQCLIFPRGGSEARARRLNEILRRRGAAQNKSGQKKGYGSPSSSLIPSPPLPSLRFPSPPFFSLFPYFPALPAPPFSSGGLGERGGAHGEG